MPTAPPPDLTTLAARRRWTRAEADAVAAAWQASGSSLNAFAKQHGIHVKRLARCLQGRAWSPGPSPAPPVRLLRVHLAPPERGAAAPRWTSSWGDAASPCLGGFDPERLRDLVRALGDLPC